MSATISLRGDKRAIRKLKQLENRVARKYLRKAAKHGLLPIRDTARSLAPVKTGALQKAIKMRAGKVKRGSGIIRTAVAVGKKWFVGDQFYAAFQEFGWRVGKRVSTRKRMGRYVLSDPRRKIEGKHFIERAYDMHAVNALARFRVKLRQLVLSGLKT